jgi:nicotinamidase-related amidase
MSALLLIDMQVGMTWPAPSIRNNLGAEQVIGRLLQAWRDRKLPIVHIRHISRTPGSPFWPGQKGVEFQPALAPLLSEHVVEKNVPDAFVNTGLERWLHARGISSVVIVGVSTNNSVESTARSSGNLGFKTFVVADGTFTFEKIDFNGVHRTAEEVHAMALANLDGEYATVIASEAAPR